jgi:hypothetical protein
MRMQWKPDKARGAKREQKQRLERTQKRKDFANNMERAEELAQELYNGTKTAIDVRGDDTLGLEQKYRDWAIEKYHYRKLRTPLSQLHKDMDETWREILATAEACAKATEARIHAQGKKAHARWIAREHERREGKRQQREMR